MTERTYIFESMPVGKAVIRQIVPAVFGQMIALIYSLADTYFVGKLGDPRATAAVTVVSSPFILLTVVSNLFGLGGGSVISYLLGKKNIEGARSAAVISLFFGLIGAVIVCALFALLSRPILNLCGAKADTLDLAVRYSRWTIVYGGIFTVTSNVLSGLIRAEGRAATAAIGVSLGGVINIVLDPLFILGTGSGAVGAGMATAISNFISFCYFLIVIIFKRDIVGLNLSGLAYTRKYIGKIIKAGLPSAVQYALTVVAIAALLHFTSPYGDEAVAAVGIVKKLDHLILYFSIGVSTGLLPMLAYNHATGNKTRLKKAFVLGSAISLSFALTCLIVYEIFAPALCSLFISDEVTVGYAVIFLRIMVVAMPMMSVCYPMIVLFQATGRVKESILCSLLRKGALDVPFLMLLEVICPLYGLMCVQPAVDTVSLIFACFFLCKKTDKSKQSGAYLTKEVRSMKKQKKNPDEKFDPAGNYTGKYMDDHGDVLPTEPEQDVDDL